MPHEVVAAGRGVLDRPRPVTAVPRWRGWQVRPADALPGLGLRAMPWRSRRVGGRGAKLRRKGGPDLRDGG